MNSTLVSLCVVEYNFDIKKMLTEGGGQNFNFCIVLGDCILGNFGIFILFWQNLVFS